MRLLTFFVAAVLVSGVGCAGKKTTEVEGESGEKLALTAEKETTLTVGEPHTFTISVERTKFTEPVEVTIENLPEGVTVEEKTKKIESGSNNATFTLKVGEEATPKEGHMAKISAKAVGKDLKEGPRDWKINIKAKDK